MPVNVIGDLWLEVTRRCNMLCPHCCRGDAQDVDMLATSLTGLLSQIKAVGNLGFTGGEPTLVPETMADILDTFQGMSIPVTTLEMVTNGKDISDEFFTVWHEWMDYCSHPEDAKVYVSGDAYHEAVSIEGLEEKFGCSVTLRGLEFVVAEGRMKDSHDLPTIPVEETVTDEDNVVSPIYLSCYGDVLPGVDFSYENHEHIKICNATEEDVLTAILRWSK